MFHILSVLSKIIPKEVETLQRRYKLLKTIQLMQPVGRRNLASKLDIGEKIIRSDTDFFREEDYINVTTSGMILSEAGIVLLDSLKEVMKEFDGIRLMEERLKSIIGCDNIIIVSGNTDLEPEAMSNIGRAAAKLLQGMINEDSIVAITGGNTLKSVVQHIRAVNSISETSLMPIVSKSPLIVPARGSLGNNVETQANTLVEALAKKLNCDYRLLNLPDNLSEKAIESVSKDPNIKKVIQEIRKATIIVFGIGNAQKMAYRRDLNPRVLNILNEKKAVAEALGYYFNQQGDMVYDSKTIGFHLDEFQKSIHPIAVAGGESKASSILAVREFIKNGSLIIDEACATEVLRLANTPN